MFTEPDAHSVKLFTTRSLTHSLFLSKVASGAL